jgi:TPR repeat protein
VPSNATSQELTNFRRSQTRLSEWYAQSVKSSDYNWDEVSKAMDRCDFDFVLKNAMPHALAGNSDAQCTISLLYQLGWGVQRDAREAERWLLKATSQDSALAWHNLGSLYFAQLPELKEKWREGRKCWERAKELGFDCAEPYPPWEPYTKS